MLLKCILSHTHAHGPSRNPVRKDLTENVNKSSLLLFFLRLFLFAKIMLSLCPGNLLIVLEGLDKFV